MRPGIYMIINIAENKCYIGQSKDVTYRLRKHKEMLKRNRHYNKELQEHWNEFGDKFFVFNVIECVDYEKLTEREEFWTLFYKNSTSCGVFNISIGRKLAESTKIKLRKANLGDKNLRYWLGKHRPEETKQKLSKTHKGLQAGEKHPMWGKTGCWKGKNRNEQFKAKLSEALKGHPVSEETRSKLSISKTGVSNVNHPLYFEATEEVLSDLREGMTRDEFVAKYGRSINTFKRIKREHGIVSKNGTANPKHALYFERTEEVIADIRNGMKRDEFVEKYKRSVDTYKAIRKKLGLTRKQQ